MDSIPTVPIIRESKLLKLGEKKVNAIKKIDINS